MTQKTRALDLSLAQEQRKLAVESIGFIDDARAAHVMLDLASNGSPMKGEATAWLFRNLSGEWAKHDIGKGLKEKGIYDPAAIVVAASPMPEPAADAEQPNVDEILKLTSDTTKGQLAAATRCILCQRIDGAGTEYGPNLKGWGATQEREAVVRAIAEPSAGIARGYMGTEVILKDGGVIHGIAFNNTELWMKDALPLVIQSAGGLTQLIAKDRIEKKHAFKRSLMFDPQTLGLSAQDIADIAAWLEGYR